MSSVTTSFFAVSSFGYRDLVSLSQLNLLPINVILIETKFSVAKWILPRVSSFSGILVATRISLSRLTFGCTTFVSSSVCRNLEILIVFFYLAFP